MEELMLETARADGQEALRGHQRALAVDGGLLEDLQSLDTSRGLRVLLHWYPGAGKTIALVTLILKVFKDGLIDACFITCPNKVPRRQTWDLLCKMLDSRLFSGLCLKVVLGGPRQDRPVLKRRDRGGKVVETEMSVMAFHGFQHLEHVVLGASSLVVSYAGREEEWTGDARGLWELAVSTGVYSCESVYQLTEVIYLARMYSIKCVVSLSLMAGDHFLDVTSSLEHLRSNAWRPALVTDEFHYGTMSGGCYSNIEKTIQPLLYVVASASPPEDFQADHVFTKTLADGLAEGLVPRYKEVVFNIQDLPDKLGIACASKALFPTLSQFCTDPSPEVQANFAQARSIVTVLCVLLLALTAKEFARSKSEALSEAVSISTSFLIFCARRWHARLAHNCMQSLLSKKDADATLKMVKSLLSGAMFREKYTDKRIDIDDNFIADAEFCDAFIPWLRERMPATRSFFVDSPETAADVASSVEDTRVITFAFNCKRLVQGWNATMLSHVVYLFWERSDAFLLQSMGRALRAAKEKKAPWCLYISDDARQYSLLQDVEARVEEEGRTGSDAGFHTSREEIVAESVVGRKRKRRSLAHLDRSTMHRVLTAHQGATARSCRSIAINAFTLAQKLLRPAWSARFGHQVVGLRGQFLLLGGRAQGGYAEDAWVSDDRGLCWDRLPAPPWAARKGHQAVAVADQAIVLGGCGRDGYVQDAWISRDCGLSWEELPRHAWGCRHGHAAIALNGRLVVLGGRKGQRGAFLRDAWASGDLGRSWERLPLPPWCGRSGHQLVGLGNRLFVIGGEGQSGYLQEVWVSNDGGACWEELPKPPWAARSGHQVVAMGETFIMHGGLGESGYLHDAWASSDGCLSWKELPLTPWASRVFHQTAVLGERIFVFGGLRELRATPGSVDARTFCKTGASSANAASTKRRGIICSDAWATPDSIV